MPYIGLLPFLPPADTEEKPKKRCVNALYRASPISTPTPTPEPEDPEVCQCPISGFSHFYDPVDPEPTPDPVVSMPYIGLLPFLLYPLKNLIKSMVSGTVFRG